MRILVTNDDGIHAPGINALAKAMSALGEVVVVAPDRDHTGASSALTLSAPLRVFELSQNRYCVQGTPTDCVHLAATGLFDKPIDIVVSGVNAGSNLGDDVFYSGTVAAAMEGRFMGLSAVAISLALSSHETQNYEVAAKVAARVVQQIMSNPLPRDTILNVNVPDLSEEDIAGFDVTRLGTRHCAEPTIKQRDPRGHTVYWIGLPGLEEDAGPGTDFYAMRSNKVSITPLQLDMTNYRSFEKVSGWAKDLSLQDK